MMTLFPFLSREQRELEQQWDDMILLFQKPREMFIAKVSQKLRLWLEGFQLSALAW